MNQYILNSFTATLLVTALSAGSSSYADQANPVNQAIETETASAEASLQVDVQIEAPHLQSQQQTNSQKLVRQPANPEKTVSDLALTGSDASRLEPLKVGEYKTRTLETTESEAIAKVQSHPLSGRNAATLYIRNIPVITFLGSPKQPVETGVKLGETLDHSQWSNAKFQPVLGSVNQAGGLNSEDQYKNDPIWRATTIAATLNQLKREGVNAEAIKVKWDAARSNYVITVDGRYLVEINPNTILPDTTKDPLKDALQATNRLRRLIGNATPLKEVEGLPNRQIQAAFEPVVSVFQGWASWYGPGFHGNTSANGEVFNQYALTAASPNLPFGTRVRVTNLNNGRSVVVRINDRGPYAEGRIIDLSAGAAQVLGMMQSGVAPVRLDILGVRQTASTQN
ncbi:hypothetical protein BST81_20590 [Leptolyngbya sp. 'hensonii']|uniref:septal ring lytic transglycosylase RlpA family protein n=1 Tax=Leptolyngbya sp. 'hensonii' TaxID=1922337 RepID=UPI0009502946|nr:septal ring lytic transglycosylase RlpA family protein [Leptolyngbya sp. 'hensonii']OLP16597.1 hypothetical protein BST81_20590 [Leptolyngbya sp. 'hensonii']